MAEVRRHFSLSQVMQLTGLSDWMVDYLCRVHLVVDRGRTDRGKGKRRRFTFADVVLLRALAHLLACGVTVARLRKAVMELREKYDFGDLASLPGKMLVTDGVGVYLRNGSLLEDLARKGQYALAFVRLELVSEDLNRKISNVPERNRRDLREQMRKERERKASRTRKAS